MRKTVTYIFFVSHVISLWSGTIEHRVRCALPDMGKTIFMYGETHGDPFDREAIAQREELATSIDAICDAHEGPLSCYLECDINVQRSIQEAPYFYLRNVCDKGAYFEQWYVPLARAFNNQIGIGRLSLSTFDIRDDNYAAFSRNVELLVDGEIDRNAVNFDGLRVWADEIDRTLHQLFNKIENRYSPTMIAYVDRDIQRKKKRFLRLLDEKRQANKRSRYTDRDLENFYNYTDLLVDLTILNKVANDPRDTIIINAGSAHTQNLSDYFNRI
jgi:hypothetical protein